MSKRINYLRLKSGLLLSLLIICPLAAYADSGQSIIVSTPDDPNHPVKLRPFVRNRALPSRAQITALQEERAQIAEEVRSQGTLNGQVSAFENLNTNYNPYTSGSRRHFSRLHKTNRPIASPVVNTDAAQFCIEQASPPAAASVSKIPNSNQGFSFLRMAEQHLSSSFNPPADTSASSQAPPVTQFSEALPSRSMSDEPLSLSVSPVTAIPSTPAISDPTGFGNAGPPPFPLNLLPAPALKQLIRSMAYGSASRAGNAPPSYFGSWHNNATFGTNTPISSNGSPQGNFHSYLQVAYSNRNTRWGGAPSAVTNSHRNAHAKKRQSINNQTNNPKLISYPAYNKQWVPGVNSNQ